MAGASMESCRFVARRSPRGCFWSVVDVRKRPRRMRGRFHRYIHDLPKFWIQSSLESPKRQRMRCRWLPTIRTTPVGVRGPICIHKK